MIKMKELEHEVNTESKVAPKFAELLQHGMSVSEKKKPALNHLSTRAFVTIDNCFNSEFRQSHISAMGVSRGALVGPCVFDCGSCNCQT